MVRGLYFDFNKSSNNCDTNRYFKNFSRQIFSLCFDLSVAKVSCLKNYSVVKKGQKIYKIDTVFFRQ